MMIRKLSQKLNFTMYQTTHIEKLYECMNGRKISARGLAELTHRSNLMSLVYIENSSARDHCITDNLYRI